MQVFEIRAVAPKEQTNETIGTREARVNNEVKEVKTTDQIASPDISRGFKKTIAVAATIYSTSQIVVNPLLREMTNQASVSGDYVQATNIARTQAIVDKSVNLGLEIATIGIATLINPALGGAALLGSVVGHTQQAIGRNQANRAMENKNNIDNYLTSYESSRFINIKAGR